jgi:hypothetical protein
VGQLSNPAGPLKTVLEREPDSARPRLPNDEPGSIGSEHRRAGWIVEAIVRVLAERGEPMQAKAVSMRPSRRCSGSGCVGHRSRLLGPTCCPAGSLRRSSKSSSIGRSRCGCSSPCRNFRRIHHPKVRNKPRKLKGWSPVPYSMERFCPAGEADWSSVAAAYRPSGAERLFDGDDAHWRSSLECRASVDAQARQVATPLPPQRGA